MSALDKLYNLNEFLSFDSKPLTIAEVSTKWIKDINIFLLDAYNLKKTIQAMIDSNNPELCKSPNTDTIKKFKLLIDLSHMYANPNLFDVLKQFQKERKMELEKEEELEKFQRKIREARENYASNHYNPSYDDSHRNIGLDWSTHGFGIGNIEEEDDICSEMSEDEFMIDEVTSLLDQSYSSIEKDSVLMQLYHVERFNHCNIIEKDDEEENEEVETKPLS